MSQPRSLSQNVFIPLFAMVGILAVLGFGGMSLLSGGSSEPAAVPTQSVDGSAAPSQAATIAPLPSVEADPARPAVIVLNGTTTAGLASKTGDALSSAGWVIDTVGNWEGDPLEANTVYYGPSAQDFAQQLADAVGGQIAEAMPDMSQTSLTLVIAKN
jgi:hypothetical protein